ncbi:uncharacterized protein V1518DRAFT_416030 [Limtongia smithiae]|uniref:uncharacterized protein n=1 Tax=Limtongia smithiae TaxID=1125753 RepID=UPI0034CF0367
MAHDDIPMPPVRHVAYFQMHAPLLLSTSSSSSSLSLSSSPSSDSISLATTPASSLSSSYTRDYSAFNHQTLRTVRSSLFYTHSDDAEEGDGEEEEAEFTNCASSTPVTVPTARGSTTAAAVPPPAVRHDKCAAEFLDLLATPPVLSVLATFIGYKDLSTLRLVCQFANAIISETDEYYAYLRSLTIRCTVATFACKDTEEFERGRCMRCDNAVCRNCISKTPTHAASSPRARHVCSTCRSSLMRGRCQCELHSRWICPPCHLREVYADDSDFLTRRNACFICRRQIDKSRDLQRHTSSLFTSFVSRDTSVCSWCNNWMA